MWDGGLAGFLVSAAIAALIILPIANYFYQRRAQEYFDSALEDLPEEYNRQIKRNAQRILINRLIWAFLFLFGFIFNFREAIAFGISWQAVVTVAIGFGFIAWGIWGYKRERWGN